MNKAVARCGGCQFFVVGVYWWFNTEYEGHCMNKESNFKGRYVKSEACWFAEPQLERFPPPLHVEGGGCWIDPT